MTARCLPHSIFVDYDVEIKRDGSFRSGDAGAMATVVIGCLDGVLLQELLEPGCTRPPAVRRLLRETLERALRDGGPS